MSVDVNVTGKAATDPVEREALMDAISRGVALLDEQRPGWRSQIDTSRLYMGMAESCVVGQLWNEPGRLSNPFEAGQEALGIDEEQSAHWYGFDVGPGWAPYEGHEHWFFEASYHEMTQAWRAVIEKGEA